MSQKSKNQIHIGSLTGHGGVIIGGARKCTVENTPLSRIGDAHFCPIHGINAIAQGSNNTTTENSPNARLKDLCMCGAPCLPPCVKTFTNI